MADHSEPNTNANAATSSTSNSESQSQSTPSTTTATANLPESETCVQCAKTDDKPLKQCSKCHSVSYCSKECQKAHFKSHKKVCASLAQEYTKTHEPKMASRAPARGGERDRGLQKWQFDT